MVLGGTPVGPLLFALLSRRFVIDYFLRRTWGSNQVDEELIDAAFDTARSPGAYRAPCAFLSGKLFTRGISEVYRSLSPPLLITSATRGDFSDPVSPEQLAPKTNVQIEVIEGGAMPHFEKPERFSAAYDQFRAANI
jgi:pimeloyl-ACP methyl ester carboxylesterase